MVWREGGREFESPVIQSFLKLYRFTSITQFRFNNDKKMININWTAVVPSVLQINHQEREDERYGVGAAARTVSSPRGEEAEEKKRADAAGTAGSEPAQKTLRETVFEKAVGRNHPAIRHTSKMVGLLTLLFPNYFNNW